MYLVGIDSTLIHKKRTHIFFEFGLGSVLFAVGDGGDWSSLLLSAPSL